MEGVFSIIGAKVKITTTLGEEVSGEIFSYDNTTNCVILIDIPISSKN